jgi:cytochrome P450
MIGSLISSFSGIPPLDESTTFEAWPELRRRFGDFYSIGIPGVGEGWLCTLFVIQDPKEMMKLLRREGIYPTSIVQKQWPVIEFFNEEYNSFGRVIGLMQHGPEWKRIRSFLQTDLLSPQSAARYMPGIIRAAEYASKGAASNESNLKLYLNEASFDMFSMILLGDLPRIADPSTESQPDDVRFCRSVAKALSLNSTLNSDVKSILLNKMGIKSSLYKEFADNWREALSLAEQKIDQVVEKRNAGTLTKEEADSYLNQAMDRQIAEAGNGDDPVTVEEVKAIAKALLSASVDTTSGMMAWHLLHVAQNPNVQDRIRAELQQVTVNGKLTPESVSMSSVPLLHAAIRESHRLTSPAPLSAFRILPAGVEVHGFTLPENSTVVFDGYSRGRDPDLLDDVDEFRPERWLPEAVEERKGTPAEVLDHPLFSGPFSQGARRCPGSRVSRNEVLIFLSQLILDWEITTPVKSWKDVPVVLDTMNAPKLPKIEFKARH